MILVISGVMRVANLMAIVLIEMKIITVLQMMKTY